VFTLGVDAKLDPASSGTSYDNGNNLVQRGLFNAAAQYKLQLDGRRFSCRVKGDEGAVEVQSPLRISPKKWYRASCKRQRLYAGDRLVLKVAPIARDGSARQVTKTLSAVTSVGNLDFPVGTPMSVGGKLNADSTISNESDQFNGVLDSAYLKVG
jgi:hypothetical protein